MGVYYQCDAPVDTRDTDLFGQCRPSALLSKLQEAATAAAIALDVSREQMMGRYHAFWMLARIWYRLDRPLYWSDHLSIKTWHRGGKGAAMYRDYDLLVDGVPVGEAVSTWVLADVDTHRLAKLSHIAEFQGSDGGDFCKSRLLTKIKLPDQMISAGSRLLHYSDTDVNRHVNNARYADYVCDVLRLEELGEGMRVAGLQIGYLAECKPGETLELLTGGADGCLFVHGADGGKKGRFDACLQLEGFPPPVGNLCAKPSRILTSGTV